MARTLCSSGGPLLVLKLVIASKGGHFLPLVQLNRDNYAINGIGRDFPSIYRECALLFGRLLLVLKLVIASQAATSYPLCSWIETITR
ncbi:TPA: hypothetical protein JD264_16800 [Serratia fonticola]|nr:hypothetical protein [Serratia fonticola]